VKAGDEIAIAFGDKTMKVRVVSVAETVKKEEAKEMYEIVL
jgi:ribosomal 50S subunit-recycling heat shock protein